jgi:predicted GNAT family N-acyltransferase
MDTAIRRNHGRQLRLDRAEPAQVLQAIDAARSALALADHTAVLRMIAKNPDIVRIAREPIGGATRGLFAYLPLNPFGAWTVLTGRYDGSNPDPAWITGPGEQPVAIAIWLIVAPEQLMRMLEPIARIFRSQCPDGCVIFSYGATPASASIQRSLGFRAATDYFPGAPSHLMAACPDACVSIDMARELEAARQSEVTVRLAQSIEDIARIFSIRSATFQAEQSCPYEEEFDGNDFCASQLLATVGGDPAGCIRIRYFGDFAKLERLAIKREYRSRHLSGPLIHAALGHCARKGFARVYGHSRADLVGFWRRYGFEPMPGRRSFHFSEVEYVEIETELKPDPLAICFGIDPMISIRPEGAWDSAGPLDYSLVRASLAA